MEGCLGFQAASLARWVDVNARCRQPRSRPRRPAENRAHGSVKVWPLHPLESLQLSPRAVEVRGLLSQTLAVLVGPGFRPNAAPQAASKGRPEVMPIERSFVQLAFFHRKLGALVAYPTPGAKRGPTEVEQRSDHSGGNAPNASPPVAGLLLLDGRGGGLPSLFGSAPLVGPGGNNRNPSGQRVEQSCCSRLGAAKLQVQKCGAAPSGRTWVKNPCCVPPPSLDDRGCGAKDFGCISFLGKRPGGL